jgi:hypothetical protein
MNPWRANNFTTDKVKTKIVFRAVDAPVLNAGVDHGPACVRTNRLKNDGSACHLDEHEAVAIDAKRALVAIM